MLRITCCVLLCWILVACSRGEQTPAPANPPVPLTTAAITNRSMTLAAGSEPVKALGVIRPWQTLNLSFRASAPVKTLAVQSGSPVAAGALLAELDSTELILSL